jgi:hypothetical protein
MDRYPPDQLAIGANPQVFHPLTAARSDNGPSMPRARALHVLELRRLPARAAFVGIPHSLPGLSPSGCSRFWSRASKRLSPSIVCRRTSTSTRKPYAQNSGSGPRPGTLISAVCRLDCIFYRVDVRKDYPRSSRRFDSLAGIDRQERARIALTSSIFHIVLRTVAREIVRNFSVLGGFMDDTDGHWAPAAKKQWTQ